MGGAPSGVMYRNVSFPTWGVDKHSCYFLELSGQDRLPLFRLHFHTFEGRGAPVGELTSHHYAVECPLALVAHHPSSSAPFIPRSGALTNRLGTGLSRTSQKNSGMAK